MAAKAIDVSLETTPRKTFASAVDWPGWSRSGKSEELAIEALLAYAERYAIVVDKARARFPAPAGLEATVVERQEGSAGTEFGVPSRPSDHDARPTTRAEADRLARIVGAAWQYFDGVARAAPAELRKGPRGGGRDTAKIVEHVDAADGAYAREMGLKTPESGGRRAVLARRRQMLELLRAPSDGSPLAGRRWPPRYAAHRIAWHALDHAWEIEDRSQPAQGIQATGPTSRKERA